MGAGKWSRTQPHYQYLVTRLPVQDCFLAGETATIAGSCRSAPIPAAAARSHDTGSVDQRLARLLDSPQLARVVPRLAPETLQQLIRFRGLDACGELVAAATPAQLKAGPRRRFVVQHTTRTRRTIRRGARFGEWIEFLVDTGGSAAARTVAAFDEHLVITGLARYVRVFDHATFAPAISSDDEPFDVAVTPAGDSRAK